MKWSVNDCRVVTEDGAVVLHVASYVDTDRDAEMLAEIICVAHANDDREWGACVDTFANKASVTNSDGDTVIDMTAYAAVYPDNINKAEMLTGLIVQAHNNDRQQDIIGAGGKITLQSTLPSGSIGGPYPPVYDGSPKRPKRTSQAQANEALEVLVELGFNMNSPSGASGARMDVVLKLIKSRDQAQGTAPLERYVFWGYDLFPYVLGGPAVQVERDDGTLAWKPLNYGGQVLVKNAIAVMRVNDGYALHAAIEELKGEQSQKEGELHREMVSKLHKLFPAMKDYVDADGTRNLKP